MVQFYNTLTRKKEVFKPRKNGEINLFVCGPTTYDFSHLGHARTYVVFDIIVKYLRQAGYDVFYLQNITDIDDKIINRASKENADWKDLSKKFEKEYLKDMRALKVDSVNQYAPATKHIRQIISQVRRLLKLGFAYQIEDGIYYDVSKFRDYGKLSKRTSLQAEDAVSRIDQAKGKKHKGDFCLWKKSPVVERSAFTTGQAKPFEEPSWSSPWGRGRPGWHIEDTAITEKYFGPQYDVHGGARDLIFPHHEAEISQMEAISKKSPMVKYWLHTGFLNVNGQKMAKSLGNFITIRDFLKENPSRLLRFFVIKTHYRSPIDYTEKSLSQSKKELERIDEFVEKIRSSKSKIQNESQIQISKYEKEFEAAMEGDFNTPKALAVIFELISQGNALIAKKRLSLKDAGEILGFLKKIDEFFDFIFRKKLGMRIPPEIKKLAMSREKYREEKNWQKADEIRQEVKKMGYWIEDTEKGPKIKPLSF
jgi:cysteinyl-tRNA synthetase